MKTVSFMTLHATKRGYLKKKNELVFFHCVKKSVKSWTFMLSTSEDLACLQWKVSFVANADYIYT